MIKTIATILFITTFPFGALFAKVLQTNNEISLENYEKSKDLTDYETLISAGTKELKNCRVKLYEYVEYFGAWELSQRKEFYLTPAEEWIDIIDEDLLTATSTY